MRKLLLTSLTTAGVLAVLGVIWFYCVVTTSMTTGQTASKRFLVEQELGCPPSAEEVSRPWSKAGWMRFCEESGVKNGPWLTASAGKLAIRGEYAHGEKTGVWEWYGDDGAVIRREVHPADQEESSPPQGDLSP